MLEYEVMGYCDDCTHVCCFILCFQGFLEHFCESVSLDDQSRDRGERSSPVGNWEKKDRQKEELWEERRE